MLNIDIIKTCNEWRTKKYSSKSFVRNIINKTLTRFPNIIQAGQIEVAILLTDNEQMKKLNNEFLGKNKPTNVLSFPDAELNYKTILELKVESDYINLGDIAFGYEIIEQEANDQGKEFEHHFTHLLIHGLLHLLGFDHETKDEARDMKNIEIKVLQELSISSPY